MKSIPALGTKNYKTDTNLLKRKVFASYCRPQIDLLDEIIKELRLRGNEKILDIGCGNGQDLVSIRTKYKHCGELYGLDIAKGILAKAKNLNQKNYAKIKFIEGDAKNIVFLSNSFFDVVIIKHVLHNIPNFRLALKESHRVLKQGGKLVIALNGKRTRLILRKLKPKIAKILEVDFFPDADGHLNLENSKRIFKEILPLKFRTIKFQSEIQLKKIKPYLDYVDSGRDFWGRISEKRWKKVMSFSKKYFEDILKIKKEIRDFVTVGFLIAKKL